MFQSTYHHRNSYTILDIFSLLSHAHINKQMDQQPISSLSDSKTLAYTFTCIIFFLLQLSSVLIYVLGFKESTNIFESLCDNLIRSMREKKSCFYNSSSERPESNNNPHIISQNLMCVLALIDSTHRYISNLLLPPPFLLLSLLES